MGLITRAIAKAATRAAEKEVAETVRKVAATAPTPKPKKASTAAPARRGSTSAPTSSLAVPRPAKSSLAVPAVIRARSGTARANAQDVLAEAGAKKGVSFADWRKANDANLGTLFDYSQLSQVPDVAQFNLERYVPKRGPSDRMLSILLNPEVVRGVNDVVERGIAGGGRDWYNTDPARQRLMGDDQRYARLMDIVAGTSPGQKVSDNIRTASYYNYLLENDLPIPDKPAPGYGAKTQGNHVRHARNIAAGNPWDLFNNPKPASFSQNLQGNQMPATIDTHNMRLPAMLSQDPRFLMGAMKLDKDSPTINPRAMYESGELSMEDALQRPVYWESKPNANEYGYYENWQQSQAEKMGISPAQYQASMWLGGGDDTGLGSTPEPFLKTLEARVKYTADRLGLPPDAVLEQMVRGDIPLLAKGGAVNVAALRAKYGC